jgi:pSer/pThr/pTyr-binding forkhead associated (FHA) protein
MPVKLLEQADASEQRREIAITKEEFLIGRGADCDLRLAVKAVSRHHCLLRTRSNEITLADLGSANGTFVNDQRIRSQVTLRHGDKIGIGDFRFLVELEGPSGIAWGPESGAAPNAPTCRMHPPGEKPKS